MKVSIIKPKEPKTFKPFTLQLEVETKEDLLRLWHRFNLNAPGLFRDAVGEGGFEVPTYMDQINVWEVLDAELRRQ